MVLEAISQCTVCGNEFPYRKSKQFCSNACKQQAYLKSKAGIPLEPITAQRMPKADFSLKEFEDFNEVHGCDFSMLYYCFFRRNLPVTATLDQINIYINSFYKQMDDVYEYMSSTKAYATFKEEFLSGKFVIGE
ncbi:hypothetical protein [Fibrivirga algicola]|uniref:Uncharacterized protein n=1 Tax=Fibrivirga algicola TaxID=2950420 RepID=A0ABX0Q9S4_9BACT|nr:hypothetical protein [Fibrivirga algicola]NID08930.1 hypothetical protein [Fibrivirga algicola]